MAALNGIVKSLNSTSLNIDRLCNIKKYISIKEKIDFVNEYKELVKQHVNEYPGFEGFIGFIFFNLMIVKKYTNIELEMTYEEFDILQENGIVSKIVEMIGDDYSLLLKLIELNNIK